MAKLVTPFNWIASWLVCAFIGPRNRSLYAAGPDVRLGVFFVRLVISLETLLLSQRCVPPA